MNDLSHIPTPETDAHMKTYPFQQWDYFDHQTLEKMGDLERRLTVAREALELVSKNRQPHGPFWYGGEIQTKVREALIQTAPKPCS